MRDRGHAKGVRDVVGEQRGSPGRDCRQRDKRILRSVLRSIDTVRMGSLLIQPRGGVEGRSLSLQRASTSQGVHSRQETASWKAVEIENRLLTDSTELARAQE